MRVAILVLFLLPRFIFGLQRSVAAVSISKAVEDDDKLKRRRKDAPLSSPVRRRKIEKKKLVLEGDPIFERNPDAEEEEIIRVDPNTLLGGTPLKGTAKNIRMSIISGSLGDLTVAPVSKRVDGIRSHMTIKSKQALVSIQVEFIRQPQTGSMTARCSLVPDGSGAYLRGRESLVTSWCSSIWSWIVSYVPDLQPFQTRVTLQQEINCDVISSMRWPGQEVPFNTESLWGRFERVSQIPNLPAREVEVLQAWSRIAITQSRNVNDEYRNYIIKQYLYPDQGAAADFIAHPPTCTIEDRILKHASDLRMRHLTVALPSLFDMHRANLAVIPTCLAAYPPNTVIQYTDDNNKRRTLICDRNTDFAEELDTEPPDAPPELRYAKALTSKPVSSIVSQNPGSRSNSVTYSNPPASSTASQKLSSSKGVSMSKSSKGLFLSPDDSSDYDDY